MQHSQSIDDYILLDSGSGQKLERFGPFVLARPAAQAVWKPQHTALWKKANATFTRDGTNQWIASKPLPPNWNINVDGIHFKLSPTEFGHLGIFPEQRSFWKWMRSSEANLKGKKVLNLFAYSGGVTLAAALAGAEVCHLDASKPMVAWARENATLNNLDNAPIRWIVDDVSKFLSRELKRGKQYDAIILDPPTFGRGPKGELFKIEEEIGPLLEQCRALLTPKPLFIALSCHTPGFTPHIMHGIMQQAMQGLPGSITTGELLLECAHEAKETTFSLPSGTFARWSYGK